MAKEEQKGGFQDLDKRLMYTYSEWHLFLIARKKELENYLAQSAEKQVAAGTLEVEVELA